VGCGLELMPPGEAGKSVKRDAEGNPMWTARGNKHHPSNLGQVCIKGATVGETLAKGRLSQPLYRPTFNDNFQPISWDSAFDLLTGRIRSTLSGKGADAIAMMGPASSTLRTTTWPRNS
tara:strand:- start:44 stop:400 length:357 start_codon:yes stop_codon:yes gene_type:complete